MWPTELTPLGIFRVFCTMLAALAVLLPYAPGAKAQPHEDAVKATFLYRFGSFAEWPATAFAAPDAPIVLCISGASSFAAVVERAASGERIAGREVVVRRIGVVSGQSGCHILYAAGAGSQSVAQSLSVVRGEPVLTITDSAHGSSRGAIHFVVVQDRVRFHIDRSAAERNHISLSSRLMGIALSVRRG